MAYHHSYHHHFHSGNPAHPAHPIHRVHHHSKTYTEVDSTANAPIGEQPGSASGVGMALVLIIIGIILVIMYRNFSK